MTSLSHKRLCAITTITISHINNRDHVLALFDSLKYLSRLETLAVISDYLGLRALFKMIVLGKQVSTLYMQLLKLQTLREVKLSGSTTALESTLAKRWMEVTQESLYRAIVCGRVMRMIRDAWQTGTVKLKGSAKVSDLL